MELLRDLARVTFTLACVFGFTLLLPKPADADRSTGVSREKFGVLVMSHGGSPEWNATVEEMVRPLRGRWPVEIAFGMADASTLQAAVCRLEKSGVRQIGVVRLFVWGESFYTQTRQVLGLDPGAPARTETTDPAPGGGCAAANGHGAGHAHGAGVPGPGAGPERLLGPKELADHLAGIPFWRVESTARIALARTGLAESPLMADVLRERVAALSKDPARESVLVLAHGPGCDEENGRWLAALDRLMEGVRNLGTFRAVRVATLREDWPEKRNSAIAEIRAFVQEAGRDGGTVLVVPGRVAGFGPYAEVLAGLPYVADQRGFAPHANVTRWIAEQAEALEAGFKAPAGASPE